MPILRLLLILLCSPVCLADLIEEKRVWTGKNGVKIAADAAIVSQDRQSVELLVNGELRKVAISNLSDADQDFIGNMLATAAGEIPPPDIPAGDPSDFKSLKKLDRTQLPNFDLAHFKTETDRPFIRELCNFMIWWDLEDIIPIPKGADLGKKAEWIHERMVRHCDAEKRKWRASNEGYEGVRRYFDREIPGTATFRFHSVRNFNPENLSKFVTGANATLLFLEARGESGKNYFSWAAVLSADKDGRISLQAWGKRFDAVIVENPREREVGVKNQKVILPLTYLIHFTDPSGLPDHIKEDNAVFLLGGSPRIEFIVIAPYLFAKPGVDSPPPPDPLFDEVNPQTIKTR